MDEFNLLYKKLSEIRTNIGEMVISFAGLEDTLNTILIETINEHNEDMGWMIIGNMSFSAKVDLFFNLNNHMMIQCDFQPKYIKLLSDIVENLKTAGNKRNDVIHAAWYDWNIKTSEVRTKIKTKKDGPKHIFKKITKKEIRKTINFIDRLNGELDEFWEIRNDLLYRT